MSPISDDVLTELKIAVCAHRDNHVVARCSVTHVVTDVVNVVVVAGCLIVKSSCERLSESFEDWGERSKRGSGGSHTPII